MIYSWIKINESMMLWERKEEKQEKNEEKKKVEKK